jgi:hypothetical protein
MMQGPSAYKSDPFANSDWLNQEIKVVFKLALTNQLHVLKDLSFSQR